MSAQAVTDLAMKVLPLTTAELKLRHFYSSLPLCIVDAVFSIGVKYTGTARTVREWALRQTPPWTIDRRTTFENRTVDSFLALLSAYTDEQLSTEVFCNLQRTSSTNGILKAAAVRRFASALRDAGIQSFDDVSSSEKMELARSLVVGDGVRSGIPGQKSGISFDYFCLLAGHENVKADRMICRFVATSMNGKSVNPKVARQLVVEATGILMRSFPTLTVRLLDSEIWAYESARAAATPKKKRLD